MPIHFDCTMCGRCCQDLKLPLSVPEAISWLARGGDVQLLCEAFAWPGGYDPTPQAVYGWHRSFAAVSDRVPVRIAVTLVGAFAGDCPYLLADRKCGGYEDRPGVCRIYPAEINPTAMIDPHRKLCPPEAWGVEGPVLAIDGACVDPKTRQLIDRARAAGAEDIAAKQSACALLGIADAAFANEGFAVHAPDRAQLLAVLRAVGEQPPMTAPVWRIVTNRASTLTMLLAAGADGALASADRPFGYHGFFAEEHLAAAA